MVDFKKRLSAKDVVKKINPIEIYDSLDRASDKGPLRPAQESILNKWNDKQRNEKDVIVKLHTGQGKTLIGLLMLQSKLNENCGPVVYLCPNIFLVDQTCEQAKQFGFKFCRVGEDNHIPLEFYESKSILITHVQLMFNGLTKFKLGRYSEHVGAIVLDDSHACIEAINEAFTIKIPRKENIYKQIITLFAPDLEYQGSVKFEQIKNGEYDGVLPIPYWAWIDKNAELVKLLVENQSSNSIKFSLPLVENDIKNCSCIISSQHIEIVPNRKQISLFGSFDNASHRILMSATTNNDSFFIKGLDIETKTIEKPLSYDKEKWSGEKMILIPYLMHDDLTRIMLVNSIAKPSAKRKYGVVAITPSTKVAKLWVECGAVMANSENIDGLLKMLKDGNYENTIVIANRYDGVDLPDDSCRILVIDLKPYAPSLLDSYQEHCRPDSEIIDVKIAQKIEQGLGRGVRGEKDYCIIILSSPDIINKVRNTKLKKYFSAQTNKQIEIGLEVAEMAIEDASSNNGFSILNDLIKQALNRDEGWKSFYVEKMNEIEDEKPHLHLLELLKLEKDAEEEYYNNSPTKAVNKLQNIMDKHLDPNNKNEKGWYLQEMARYTYQSSKSESNQLQVEAHKLNRALLRPQQGMEFQKLKINNNRIENIKKWFNEFETFEELKIRLVEINNNLSFGMKAEKFEFAIYEIGKLLGFESERPDHDWKEGPDNLWGIRNNEYILFECKNEVDERREEISKSEAGQMNTSCAWFKLHYSSESVKNILIIPTKNIARAAAFNESVEIMQLQHLNKLKKNIDGFINEFKKSNIHNLSNIEINLALTAHTLTEDNILKSYSTPPYQK